MGKPRKDFPWVAVAKWPSVSGSVQRNEQVTVLDWVGRINGTVIYKVKRSNGKTLKVNEHWLRPLTDLEWIAREASNE